MSRPDYHPNEPERYDEYGEARALWTIASELREIRMMLKEDSE